MLLGDSFPGDPLSRIFLHVPSRDIDFLGPRNRFIDVDRVNLEPGMFSDIFPFDVAVGSIQ
ncbi:hypothetical protein O9G_003490 [Rozella allomycis CSF55]|uniref:Uncharacterized protein n=1 Tax=Rozella allomycis (strain CSF55) TaxID=988480 RepID=A0A075B2X1_ROZAC|nr:hypothetical protein O9G_003490 [Rozella allomycis CSF55]|eukprot:EPZ35118.1 hypothetical protein O9G_003490 [Rozella allomycis CSF55]